MENYLISIHLTLNGEIPESHLKPTSSFICYHQLSSYSIQKKLSLLSSDWSEVIICYHCISYKLSHNQTFLFIIGHHMLSRYFIILIGQKLSMSRDQWFYILIGWRLSHDHYACLWLVKSHHMLSLYFIILIGQKLSLNQILI